MYFCFSCISFAVHPIALKLCCTILLVFLHFCIACISACSPPNRDQYPSSSSLCSRRHINAPPRQPKPKNFKIHNCKCSREALLTRLSSCNNDDHDDDHNHHADNRAHDNHAHEDPAHEDRAHDHHNNDNEHNNDAGCSSNVTRKNLSLAYQIGLTFSTPLFYDNNDHDDDHDGDNDAHDDR